MKNSARFSLFAVALWTGLAGSVWASPPPLPLPFIQVAQTMEEEKNFFLEILELVLKGQEDAARASIVEKHELARQTFAFFMRTYPKMSDPSQRQLTSRFLNFVAVTFQTDLKEKQLVVTLKKKKIWVAPDPKKTVSPTPDAHSEAVTALESASHLAARFGNYAAQRKISDAEFRLLEKPGKGKTPDSALVNDQLLAASCLAFAGEPTSAMDLLRALSEGAALQKNAETEFTLKTLQFYAAREAGMLEGSKEFLQPQMEAAGRVKTYKGGLFRYIARSCASAYDEEISPADYLKACQNALKELDRYSPEGDILSDGRLFGLSSLAWQSGLRARLREPWADAPLRASIQAQLEKINSRAHNFADLTASSSGTLDYNPEFNLAWLELRLRQLKLQSLESREMRSSLTDLLGSLAQEEKRIKALESAWERESLHQAEPLKGTDVDAAILRFALMEGDFSRLEVLYHQLWMQTLTTELSQVNSVPVTMAEVAAANATAGPSAAETELEVHRAAAEKYQELQIRGQGAQGVQDVTWSRIDWLLSKRPNGWEISADNLIQRALQVNLDLQFRAGQILVYTYLGELAKVRNKTLDSASSWQKAVELIEAQAAQSGRGDLVDWERAYEDLAHLLIEQGNGSEAWALLARQQEVRSLLSFSGAAEGGNGLWAQVGERRARSLSLGRELMRIRAAKLDFQPVQSSLAENLAELTALGVRLKAENPHNEPLLNVQAPNLALVQKSIPKNAAIIQYFSAPEALFVLVLNASEVRIRRVEIAHGELKALVGRFDEALRKDATHLDEPLSLPTDLSLKEACSTLHRLMVDPIEGDILDRDVLVFLPGSTLELPPMAALGRLDPAKGLEFLVERKQCVTLANSSDLEFLNHPAVVAALPGPAGKEAAAPLPELKRATVAHLSESRSLVQFADEKAPQPLTEVTRLKLGEARAVALSSPKPSIFTDWTAILAALKAAGVRTNFLDLGAPRTSPLPELFFKNVREGKSPSQALQQAQLSLLASPGTAHPSLWAHYAVVGDWR